jgi:outer membrane protein
MNKYLSFISAIIGLSLCTPAFAQTTATTQTNGEVLKITADEAVRMAIANNPDLVAAGYGPRIGAESVSQARSAFLPTIQTGVDRNVQNSPPSSVFFGTAGIRTDIWSGNVGVQQQLPWGGGSYTFSWNSIRTNASSSLNNFNPSVTSALEGAVSQPLLRNFKIDPVRANVTTARENEDIAGLNLRETSETTTANAERAYWTLVLAKAAVAVQQQSLDLSLELERNNQARVNVGQSPPLDLVSARAEVAARQTDLIVAQSTVKQAEDALRVLIVDPKRPDYWSVQIQPIDLVPPVGPSPDVDAAVRTALQQRTDLLRARKQLDINNTALDLAKNQVLPDLQLQANYLTNGLGGTELLRESIFGPVTGQQPVAFGDVLRQVFVANYPTWTVGFTLAYPLGRSNQEATLTRTQLEHQQSMSQIRSAELKAVREVRQAAMQLDQNRQQIDTTHLTRQLEEQRLDAERKRFDVGMSTNYNVIQAERDLAVARNDELRAQLNYQLALIAFQTAQQVPGAVSGAISIPDLSGTLTATSTSGGGQ